MVLDRSVRKAPNSFHFSFLFFLSNYFALKNCFRRVDESSENNMNQYNNITIHPRERFESSKCSPFTKLAVKWSDTSNLRKQAQSSFDSTFRRDKIMTIRS